MLSKLYTEWAVLSVMISPFIPDRCHRSPFIFITLLMLAAVSLSQVTEPMGISAKKCLP